MAHVTGDRVKETTTTTGTGAVTLAGAVSGFRAFSDVAANGDTVYYCIAHQSAAEWETGLGTWGTGGILTRTTVIASSNAGAAVNFSAGTKNVFVGPIASEQSKLRLRGLATPAAAPAGMLDLYARSRAGRMFLEQIGPSGIDTSLQPALFGNNVIMWLPGTGTTAAISFGGAWTVGATQAHPAITTTNMLTQMKRATYTTSTTSGNASGVRASAVSCWRGNAAGLGGFFFFARFGVVTFQSAMEIWCGLSAATGLLAGAPSAQNNTVCIGKDTGDTNWQLIFRDGSTATKVNLGLAVAANQVLDVMFFCPPNGSNITARVRRLDVDTVLADNTVHTANLPTSASLLVPHAECRTNAASAVAIALNRIYLESDT